MSFLWAISLILVKGTDAVNSALKDGRDGWILRITRTSCCKNKSRNLWKNKKKKLEDNPVKETKTSNKKREK